MFRYGGRRAAAWALFAGLLTASGAYAQADVLRRIDNFEVWRPNSQYVVRLDRTSGGAAKNRSIPVKMSYRAQLPAAYTIPRYLSKDFDFTVATPAGTENCKGEIDTFISALRQEDRAGRDIGQRLVNQAGKPEPGYFVVSFVIAGETHEWTKVEQIIEEHSAFRPNPNPGAPPPENPFWYVPRPVAGRGRLPRIERVNPMPAKIGGPGGAGDHSVLVFNDNSSVFSVWPGRTLTPNGPSQRLAAGETITFERRYGTYLFAKCSLGNERAVARVDWGAEFLISVGMNNADTSGRVKLILPTVLVNPDAAVMGNARLDAVRNTAITVIEEVQARARPR